MKTHSETRLSKQTIKLPILVSVQERKRKCGFEANEKHQAPMF